MGQRRGHRAGVVLCLLCGCAPAATAPPPPLVGLPSAPITRREADPARVAAEGPVEWPAPADLAASIRLSAPARDLPVLSLLLPLDSGVQSILDKPDAALHLVLGPALAGLVDLARPVDIAVGSPTPRGAGAPPAAFAFTLADGEAPGKALEDDFVVRPGPGGGLALDPKDGGSTGVVGSKLSCALWPPSPRRPSFKEGRLVCAAEADLLASYGPYLARGMRGSASPASLRMEMTGEFLRSVSRAANEKKRTDSAPAEGPGAEIGRRWALEILDDWDTLAFEVSLGRGRVEIVYEQTFRSSRSTTTVVACADPAAPTAPPPALFRMPADTDVALYAQGAPKEVMKTRGPEVFKHLLQEMPESELPAIARDEVGSAFGAIFLTGGPLVVGYGHDREVARAALDRYLATKPPRVAGPSADPGFPAARRSLEGWSLSYTEEPIEAWGNGLRQLLRVNATDYAARARKLAAAAPGGGKAPPAPPEPSRALNRVIEVPVTASEALPAGSLHFARFVKPNPKYVPPKGADTKPAVTHEVHLWLAPEGSSTWMALSEDPRLGRDRLRQVLAGGPAAPSTAPPMLAPLRGAVGAGAGVMTLAGLVSLVLPDDARADLEEARRLLTGLEALPAKGESAIPLVWVTAPLADHAGGQGCRARVSVSLDKDALKSVLAWGMAHKPGRSR